MTFNEIENEYWETFDINQGADKINGYPVIKISDTYSRPATVEDFESFFKQSFIKYLQSEVEFLKDRKKDHCGEKDCRQGQCLNRMTRNETIDHVITHINQQLKELQ